MTTSSSTSLASQTSTSRPAKLLDAVLGRNAADQLAVVAERGEQHVRADGRHQHVVGERRLDVQDARARRMRGFDLRGVGQLCAAGALELLLRRAAVHEAPQLLDQRARVETLLPVLLDRVDRVRERVQAGEHGVDGVAFRARRCAGAAARRRPPCGG